MLETVTEIAVGIFAAMGAVVVSVLTIQFATNASRNMSLTNTQATGKIAKGG